MKKHVLLGFLLLAGCVSVLAQNKTLGVGVTTPNPNAALHVESPTGNQGFILPRLTTAQRTASGFTSVLGAADNGLMVYDTDLSSVFIWDGASWGGPQLSLPYADVINAAPDGSDLLRLVYGGSAAGNVGVAHFETVNPNSSAPALWAQTNSNQPLSAAIYGLNTGTGDAAGVFRISNAASTFSAAYAETNGSGPAFYANQTGNGGGIYVVKNGGGSQNVAAVFSRHLGPSGYAGIFQNENAANPRSALFAESVGTGESIWAQKSMPTSTGIAIFGDHMGSSGQAGLFTISNNANQSNALEAKTNGMGSAARFEVNNVNSSSPALWVQTNSDQPLSTPIYGLNTGTGDPAGVFRISNAASAVSALYGEHNGAGPAVFGNQSGTGRAGQFQITNASNSESALRAVTTSGSGTALGLVNSGNGNAFTIFSGGVKVSTYTVTSTSITTRAAAYRITAGGPDFMFDFGPADGEVYMVYNDTGNPINVQGVDIGIDAGKTIVNFGGTFRGL
jgi:hypothetical protein